MRRGLLLALLVAALWCATILAIHHESPRTRLSAHGLLHVAIAESCAQRAADAPWPAPPENPLFAGAPLPYYYFFHDVAVGLARLLRCSFAQAFELMILAAAAGTVVIAFLLGRQLFGSNAAGITTSFLVFAGAHPQGPLVLLARWIRHGAELFTRRGFAADGDYLWGLVHPVDGALRLGDYWATLGPLASFFLNLTARPLALCTLLGMVLALERTVARASLVNLLVVVFTTMLCTLWSPLTGLAAVGALVFGLLAVVAIAQRRGERALAPRDALAACAALVVGAALAWPWFRHLIGRGDARGQLAFNANRLVGVVSGAWLLALFAVLGLRKLRGTPRAFATALVAGAAALCVPTVVLALPVGNEDNFFHAALLLLAVPAAGIVAGTGRPWRRALAVHLAFAPTLALVLFSYTGRAPVPIAFAREGLERLPADGREARLYAWIRTQTPRDAVVVQDPGREGRECTGNTSELPAFTGRALFTDYAQHYLVAPDPEAPRRVELAQRLARGDALAAEDDRYLAALGRPLFVVSYDADAATATRLAAAFGPPRFEADGIRLFHWRAHE